MAFTPGYGGTLTLGGTTFPVRNITFSHSRLSVETTQLSDIRIKKAPGRYSRSGSFEMISQTSTSDNAIRSHMVPTDLSAATSASLALVYTDGGGNSYTVTVHLTKADRVDGGDGTSPGIWQCEFEEQ